MHKISNFYLIDDDLICILAQVNYNDINLIGIASFGKKFNEGNRWTNPVKVNDMNKITNEEFNLLFPHKNKYKQIELNISTIREKVKIKKNIQLRQ